ncbi:MAG: hypothetical protein H8E44_07745 [Planctomycetes bacterium]|nr:hypothetical protein [Planctomycetota bacterium]
MNGIARFLLLTAFGTLAIGCGRDDPPANDRASGAMEYTSAEVRILYGPLANRTKRIKDQTEIQQLLSFFPGAGRGQKPPEPPGPWDHAVIVDFGRADGTLLRVTSNYEFSNEGPDDGTYFWSEGRGDWLLAEPSKLRTCLRKLFEDETNSAKQGEE